MQRLWQFFKSYGNFFFFILLQAAGYILLFTFNRQHRLIFQEKLLAVTGQVEAVQAGWASYFDLGLQNEKLHQQNQLLQEKLVWEETRRRAYEHRTPYSAHFTILPDSLLPLNRYQFYPCRAIYNSVASSYNYITLNVGSRQGLQRGMGLISTNGLAGIVVAVSTNYAVGMSLLNKDFKVSAKVKDKDFFGTFIWDGDGPNAGRLEYIPLHFKVLAGDTVITSQYSTVFPEGFIIGRVEAVKPNAKGGFHDIRVRLSTDFHNLDQLYAVQHVRKAEIDSLTKPYAPKP